MFSHIRLKRLVSIRVVVLESWKVGINMKPILPYEQNATFQMACGV